MKGRCGGLDASQNARRLRTTTAQGAKRISGSGAVVSVHPGAAHPFADQTEPPQGIPDHEDDARRPADGLSVQGPPPAEIKYGTHIDDLTMLSIIDTVFDACNCRSTFM